IDDGCGTHINCPSCTYPQTCHLNAGGTVCCAPTTCAAQGRNCGTISDGCGGTLSCGTCATGTCGGGGVANVCGASTACGDVVSAACCSNGTCSGGLVCHSGLCEFPCSASGDACCYNSTDGYYCQNGLTCGAGSTLTCS